ncbi:hypothetical protein E1B28_012641 [Marasmius oreades]|uniref:DUF6699 domain-containing protein n=1 Tax=Marasmius oreades TaxID=181124 RepID=A0A9P7UR05_9AGAR|nr:uncharacterized protein E1B28_012641 [Marasmius oreades]KAG7088669.1 hypothetical protein E1B28_012641 [Marasmius oreades]
MHSSSRVSTPKAPKLRNIALPPASPAITPNNSTYTGPTIIANLKISTLSPSPNHQTAPHTSPSNQMSPNTRIPSNSSPPKPFSSMFFADVYFVNLARPPKSILKIPIQGTQHTPSQASSTSSSSSQKRPLKGILKNARSIRRQEDLPNTTPVGMTQSLAPHEVRPSDVGTPGSDAYGMTPAGKGGLKPGVISLNWILVHQDRDRKRPAQCRHLRKGFEMAIQPDRLPSPGAWVYDTLLHTYLNPAQFVEQSASTHSTLRDFPLHIVTAWNPQWECTVRPTSKGILCIDVFRTIFNMLQTPLTNDELRTMNMADLEHARVERLLRTPHAPRGYLRVDSLGQHRHFKGLRQKGSDWILDVFGPMDS